MYTVKIVVDKKQFKDVEEMLDDMSGDRVGQVIDRRLSEVAQNTEREMKHQAPSFTGALKESIDHEKVRMTEPKTKAYIIGPSDSYSSGSYGKHHPKNYAYYIETGRGPTDTLANPTDLALRMGISIEEAFAFAKWMRSTGKAKRSPNPFVGRTYNWLIRVADGVANNIVDDIVK